MISIIIPCFNCAAFIRRAVDSVIHQSYLDWELLLVNNNSADSTQEILCDLQKQYPDKIKVLFEGKKGAPAARNRGLYAARGEWIQFLDADDELLPDKLRVQHALALQTKAAFIAGTYTRLGHDGRQLVDETRAVDTVDIWVGLISSNLGITSANLWNREILMEVKGWDESLIASQEYDLMFRMLQLSGHVGLDARNATLVHVGGGESVSRASGREKKLKVILSKINLRIRIKAYLAAQNLLTENRRKLLDEFIFEYKTKTYRYRPYGAAAELRQMKLDVSFSQRLRSFYFMRKMDLKRLLMMQES